MAKFTRVYFDDQGETHFERVNSASHRSDSGLLSETLQTKAMFFRDSAGINDFDWHNAPQRLFIVMLEGKVEIEVSDGSKCVFEPGDVMLMEDTGGKGHKSRSPDGNGRSTMIVLLDG